jgi:hypothetical protein
MVELWRIRFTRGEQALAVASASTRDGVLFDGDGPDIFARAAAVRVVGVNDEFQRNLDNFWRVQNISAGDVTLSVEDGAIVFNYNVSTPLPQGTYRVTCDISGIDIPPRQIFESDGNTPAAIALPIAPQRSISLTVNDLTLWEPGLRTFIQTSGSRVDGRDLWSWLNDDNVESQRRACVLNILAKLRCTPTEASPLLSQVLQILGAQTERVYARMQAGLTTTASGALLNGFQHEGQPADPMHKRLIVWVGSRLAPPEGRQLHLDSYRQDVTFTSLQVVYAVPDAYTPQAPHLFPNPAWNHYADIDIDLGGSLTDVVGFFVHMSELQSEIAITDHLKMHDELLKHDNIIKQYMYYSVD